MAYDERELLARLIQCEAGGEGEIGMKAVAGVVMNRVNVLGGEYQRVGQGSLQNIVFQPGQFTCLAETVGGVYNPQNIYNMRPTQENYDIADWAMAGNRLPVVGCAVVLQPLRQTLPKLFSLPGGAVRGADRRTLLLCSHGRIL